MTPRLLTLLYSLSLYAYPRDFRRRFGAEMRQTFRDGLDEASRDTSAQPASPRVIAFLSSTARDWTLSVFKERITAMFESLPASKRRLAYTAATALLVLAAPATVLRAYVIPYGSMESTYKIGDHILATKLIGDLHRGDVVIFRFPPNPRQTYIKRVIGLPGDRIHMVNKEVYRNGSPVNEGYVQHVTPYTDAFRDNFPGRTGFRSDSFKGSAPALEDMLQNHVENGEVVVPEGQLFVLGDNRDLSLDSRFWGFVPEANVIGRPLFVYWRTPFGAEATARQ